MFYDYSIILSKTLIIGDKSMNVPKSTPELSDWTIPEQWKNGISKGQEAKAKEICDKLETIVNRSLRACPEAGMTIGKALEIRTHQKCQLTQLKNLIQQNRKRGRDEVETQLPDRKDEQVKQRKAQVSPAKNREKEIVRLEKRLSECQKELSNVKSERDHLKDENKLLKVRNNNLHYRLNLK